MPPSPQEPALDRLRTPAMVVDRAALERNIEAWR
jgi:D-serine deaminase-like pyridoxal phosphate-dependent protein